MTAVVVTVAAGVLVVILGGTLYAAAKWVGAWFGHAVRESVRDGIAGVVEVELESVHTEIAEMQRRNTADHAEVQKRLTAVEERLAAVESRLPAPSTNVHFPEE